MRRYVTVFSFQEEATKKFLIAYVASLPVLTYILKSNIFSTYILKSFIMLKNRRESPL